MEDNPRTTDLACQVGLHREIKQAVTNIVVVVINSLEVANYQHTCN